MTSDPTAGRAYVWAWLPGASEPVPAGALDALAAPDGGHVLTFNYARSYLAREDAPALYLPELPKTSGRKEPPPGLDVAGVIRDAGPDAWGQRVVMRRLLGRNVRDRDPIEVPFLSYLLESGSDRSGNLDFQVSRDHYIGRNHDASTADLLRAADDVQAGAPMDPGLADALTAGSSAGGARPKATLTEGARALIAKFSAPSDYYPVMKAEGVAMDLARCVGLNASHTEVIEVNGRDVLLVERFDRGPGGTRRAFVSGLTILGLDERVGHHATYHELADEIRTRFVHRGATLAELFGRIVFNILVSNHDDHARNHAAFWDGDRLELTPAYDICPQPRAGGEQHQAMAISTDGNRISQVAACVAAAHVYELDQRRAREIIDHQLAVIEAEWSAAADRARLTAAEASQLKDHQIVNDFTLYGYRSSS